MDPAKPKKRGARLSFDNTANSEKPKNENSSALKRRGTPHPSRLKSVEMSEPKQNKEEERFEDEDDDERSIRVNFGNVVNIDVDYNDDDFEDYEYVNNVDDDEDDEFDYGKRIQMRRPTPHPSKLKSAKTRANSFDNGRKDMLMSKHKVATRKMSEPVVTLSGTVTKL